MSETPPDGVGTDADDETDVEREGEDVPLRTRLARNPRPALAWTAVFALLLALQAGALLEFVAVTAESVIGAVVRGGLGTFGGGAAANATNATAGAAGGGGGGVVGRLAAETLFDPLIEFARSIPRLLSRETIPNQGWQVSENGPWMGTFPTNFGASVFA